MTTSSTVQQELTRMEREVGEAITRRDVAALDRLIADDFLATNPLGQVLTKQEALRTVTSPDYELESLTNEEISVRLFGDVAVATAVGTARGKYQGQEASAQFRYTRVWVKRQDCWQAVAAQSTNLPKP